MNSRRNHEWTRQRSTPSTPALRYSITPFLLLVAAVGLVVFGTGVGCGQAKTEPQAGVSDQPVSAQAAEAVEQDSGVRAPAQEAVSVASSVDAEQASRAERKVVEQAVPVPPVAAEPVIEGQSATMASPGPMTARHVESARMLTPPIAFSAPDLAPGERLVTVRMPWNSNTWYRQEWQKRSAVQIGLDAGVDLSSYPVKVVVPLQEGMKADFSDVRFTALDGVTELKYAFEGVPEGTQATVRVLASSVGADKIPQIFMYFGNADAQPATDSTILETFTTADSEPDTQMGMAADRDIAFVVVPAPAEGEQDAEDEARTNGTTDEASNMPSRKETVRPIPPPFSSEMTPKAPAEGDPSAADPQEEEF